MNFEHTEDRRMLADSLDRFIAEQVRLRDARPDRQVARGLQPGDLAASSPNSA